jgi:hypothetical protein
MKRHRLFTRVGVLLLSISTFGVLPSLATVCLHPPCASSPPPQAHFNVIPDASSTMVAVYNANINSDEIYFVDSQFHIRYVLVSAGAENPNAEVDLTSLTNSPISASPVIAATYVASVNKTYVHFIDASGHIQELSGSQATWTRNDITPIINGALVTANPWVSVASAYQPEDNTLDIVWGWPSGGNPDKYGPEVQLVRRSYNFSTNSWMFENIYDHMGGGRGPEHLETQVTLTTWGEGVLIATFDPEGEGHIHAVAYNPSKNPSWLQSPDIMDQADTIGMNVTINGGISGNNTPTCKAGGISMFFNPLYDSKSGEDIFYYTRGFYIGYDGNTHAVTWAGTNWSASDVTKISSSPQIFGCSSFTGVGNPVGEDSPPVLFYLSQNGTGYQINEISWIYYPNGGPQGLGALDYGLIATIAGGPNSSIQPIANTPLASVYDPTLSTVNVYYVASCQGLIRDTATTCIYNQNQVILAGNYSTP